MTGTHSLLMNAGAKNSELEAENARLRGEDPKALPSPESERVITPSESDIVPPAEQGKLYLGPVVGPDANKARRRAPAQRRRTQEGSAARPEAWERKPTAEAILRRLRRRAPPPRRIAGCNLAIRPPADIPG